MSSTPIVLPSGGFGWEGVGQRALQPFCLSPPLQQHTLPAAAPTSTAQPHSLTLWRSALPPTQCSDVEACAGQAPLAVSHYLSDADAAAIASSGTPTTMYVAGRDAMIPPAAQRKLGQLLGARVLDTQSSHMEASMAALEELPRHLAWAASGGGAAQPGATAGGS